MKKLLGIMMAVAMIAGLAAAEAVYSQNVVGYVNVDVPADTFVLLSTSFEASNTIEDLFGHLPNGSELHVWNQGWTTYTKGGRAGNWGAAGSDVIELGSGVFLKTPEEASVTFSGEVLLDEEFTLHSNEGYTLFSFPFAAEVEWGQTTLAQEAELGATLHVWDGGWASYTKGGRAGNFGAGETVKLELGKAYFFQSTEDGERVEIRPYDPSEWQ